MIQLFETTSIDSNCDIGPNDQPFYMPIAEGDHLFLRLQVPYYLVLQNLGGLPIGANINVSFTDAAGVVNLCDLGTPTGGKYLYNFVNDATKRIGEYRFMIPLSFVGFDYKSKGLNLNAGDEVVATLDGVVYTWIYGDDPTPLPFLDFKTGSVVIRKPDLSVLNVFVNGSGVIPYDLFVDDELSCLGSYCFRVKIDVNFTNIPLTQSYFTKMFQFNYLCGDDTILLTSEYGTKMVDCAGQLYEGSGLSLGCNQLYIRVPAGIDRVPSKLTKTINSSCFQYRSEITKQVRMRGEPVPSWFQDAVETLALGKSLKLDGVQYQLEQESFFENSDNIGSVFQNINVLLSQCKCENVFVC